MEEKLAANQLKDDWGDDWEPYLAPAPTKGPSVVPFGVVAVACLAAGLLLAAPLDRSWRLSLAIVLIANGVLIGWVAVIGALYRWSRSKPHSVWARLVGDITDDVDKGRSWPVPPTF